MYETEKNNEFKFSLYQEDLLLCEKIFDADQFNPFTRYSVNIRSILPTSIIMLQKILSKKKCDTIIEVGNDFYYDVYSYYKSQLNYLPKETKKYYEYNPQVIEQQIEGRTIRGVECKIGLYINDKPIVERNFYVDNFNPVARWSADLLYGVIEIANNIYDKIKYKDVKNMWDDYALINEKRFSINQIRDFSPMKREEMLRTIRN